LESTQATDSIPPSSFEIDAAAAANIADYLAIKACTICGDQLWVCNGNV